MSIWRNVKNPGLWLTCILVLLLGLWPILTQQESVRETIFTILLSVVLASSLNILLGYTGYVSFGHVVFFGLGGYVGLYLISVHQWSLWAAMLASGLAAGLLAGGTGLAIWYFLGDRKKIRD